MFNQISTDLEILVENLQEELKYVSALREGEINSNLYIEYGGRAIGISTCIAEVRKTQVEINNHIIEILKNTTDGNFSRKVDLLIDENEVLREKIELLEQDLEKYSSQDIKKNKKKKILHESIKELSNEEIDNKLREDVSRCEIIDLDDIDADEDDEE